MFVSFFSSQWPWARFLISVNLNFLICKLGITPVTPSLHCVRVNVVNQELATVNPWKAQADRHAISRCGLKIYHVPCILRDIWNLTVGKKSFAIIFALIHPETCLLETPWELRNGYPSTWLNSDWGNWFLFFPFLDNELRKVPELLWDF